MFVSWEFWLFVLITLILHNITRGRAQNILLLLASYAIYAYFDLGFVAVLIAATVITYSVARGMGKDARFRTPLFIIGLLFDLALLIFFKYEGFFVDSFVKLVGADQAPDWLTIVLPLGISFYSFRLLSYLFDVNNKRIAPAKSFVNMALYIAFFPQIAAGPIERATNFLPRLEQTRRLDSEQLMTALTFILIGVFYKYAIADPLVASTENAFKSIYLLSPQDALAAMVGYSIRIYGDFAGYSSMAIGVSMLFVLPAMENFRQPYLSQSVVEFWTRWHISLSSWFRDYLFFPLSRFFVKRLGRNWAFPIEIGALFVTMLVTGIWHGSNLTFVVWGALHGGFMVVERIAARFGRSTPGAVGSWQEQIVILTNILATFSVVTVGWVFFRAATLDDALLFFQRVMTLNYTFDPLWLRRMVMPVIIVMAFDLLQARAKVATKLWHYHLVWRVLLIALLLLAIFILGESTHELFIYSGF